MKKIGVFGAFMALFLIIGVVASSLVGAQTFRTGDNVSFGSGEVVESTVYTAGRNVSISSDVKGDVFCAGQTVNITGSVEGDIICAAQTINILGDVNGDIRLAAQTVTLSANVGGSATIMVESFLQDAGSEIAQDVSIASTNSTISGIVGRDLAVASENVIVSGEVGRNITGATKNLELASGSIVGGDIEYKSDNEINQAQDATVNGEIIRNFPESKSSASVFGFAILWLVYVLIAALVVSLALVLIAPKLFNSVTNQAYPRPWKALLVGFVSSVIMPIVIVLLLITVVGIPLAILFGLVWLVVAFLSGPFVGYLLGRWVLQDSNKPILIMLSGSVILLFIYIVPILGLLAMALAYWIGTGALLLEAQKHYPKPVYTIPNRKQK